MTLKWEKNDASIANVKAGRRNTFQPIFENVAMKKDFAIVSVW